MAWAQIAAHFAWLRHPGFYTSPTLEALLIKVAQRIDKQPNVPTIDSWIRSKPKPVGKTRFLHVMTESYKSGGHTLVVAGWIRNTCDIAVHSLVTTAQESPLPETLASSIAASGGWYQSLTAISSNLLERSLLLRQLGRNWADVIVLHIHPFDALPTVAFGIEEGPPVILLNHADHVFWLGASVADVVIDLHSSGQSISIKRRGIRDSKILPIPLLRASSTSSYDAARKQLGIKNDEIVLLTIGSEYKYVPFAGYDFVDVMVRILERNPKVTLFAIGPRHQGRWAEASALVGGRIKAMGSIDWSDLHTFYASADIYVESFPMGSVTAFLEAGVRAIPLIGLHLQMVPHLSGADDVAFENLNVHVSSPEAFTKSLEHMIANPSTYTQKTRHTKASIQAKHFPPGWNSYLDNIMRSLPSKHSVRLPEIQNNQIDDTDIFLAGVDAAILSHERIQNTFARIMLEHAMYLKKMELSREQARNFLETLLKTDSIKTLNDSIYYLRKSLPL